MRTTCRLTIILGACLVSVAGAHADQIVFQANFGETSSIFPFPPEGPIGMPNSVTVQQGAVFFVGGASGPPNPCSIAGLGPTFFGSTYCLQLTTASPEAVLIGSTLIGPGNYQTTVQMAGGSTSLDTLLNLGGLGSVQSVAANSPFTNYRWVNTVPDGDHSMLTFSADGSGILISSITVTQIGVGSEEAPEPASWALIGMAGLVLVAKARRSPGISEAEH
jgi:hypothetical protein